MVAVTSPLVVVPEVGEYVTVPRGATLSIRFTVAVADHVLPARSEKVNMNKPLPVNV